MKTKCPYCNIKFDVANKHKGKKAQCIKCKKPFIISELVEEVAVIENGEQKQLNSQKNHRKIVTNGSKQTNNYG